eukprot:3644269-Pleurochrysis_carterae.AAC.1
MAFYPHPKRSLLDHSYGEKRALDDECYARTMRFARKSMCKFSEIMPTLPMPPSQLSHKSTVDVYPCGVDASRERLAHTLHNKFVT